MTKIDLTMYPERLERTIQRVRERNIIIPTFEEMRNPNLIPDKIKGTERDWFMGFTPSKFIQNYLAQ